MTHTSSYTTPEDRTAAMLAHASAPIAMLVSVGWLSFVGPLLVWFVSKHRPYARRAAASAFNFNLAISGLMILGWIMVFTVVLAPVGGILMGVAVIVQIWCHLHGTLRASRGEPYRYPFELKILS